MTARKPDAPKRTAAETDARRTIDARILRLRGRVSQAKAYKQIDVLCDALLGILDLLDDTL